MCEELKLIQTHLGIWKLEDWDIKTASTQLLNRYGIYLVRNKINNMLLIGEGKISKRLHAHIRGDCENNKFLQDLKIFGKEQFHLYGCIFEKDEIKRKSIENKLQLYFKDNCYNKLRKQYPTQKQLKEYHNSHYNGTKTIDKLNNFNIVKDCWETNYNTTNKYGTINFNGKVYLHHVLMYIFYYGDICGITSTIHHKCENKRCVNPQHLELTTNIKNIRIKQNSEDTKEKIYSLKSQNFNSKEIAKILKIHITTVNQYMDFNISSIYRGVSFQSIYRKYSASIRINNKNITLGKYNTEIEAAQNRDYYIVKNNLWHIQKTQLNFHDVDYYNFTPHTMSSGRISKNL